LQIVNNFQFGQADYGMVARSMIDIRSNEMREISLDQGRCVGESKGCPPKMAGCCTDCQKYLRTRARWCFFFSRPLGRGRGDAKIFL